MLNDYNTLSELPMVYNGNSDLYKQPGMAINVPPEGLALHSVRPSANAALKYPQEDYI